jgi:hypothetical protein
MPSRPKLQRLITTLKALTTQELGARAEPLDFVVRRVAMGQTVTSLAEEVARAMGEPASRTWLSWRFNHLAPGAKTRIADARRQAARGPWRAPRHRAEQPWKGPAVLRPAYQDQASKALGRGAGEHDNTGGPRDTIPASQ